MKLFNWSKYGCMCVFAVCKLLSVAVIMVLSTRDVSYVCLGGVGMFEVCMLKSVSERIPPCGTTALK